MEPESDPIDLSVLDPSRGPRWEDAVARVASRAVARIKLRRAALRRGSAVAVLAAAAAVALWLSPSRRPRADALLLDWATGSIDADDILSLGGPDAP